MAFVITHPEMGIYVGNSMGLGFWTKLDSVGQPEVVTFNHVDDAKQHIASWDSGNDPAEYGFAEVEAAGHYATIPALLAAGLEDLMGDMVAESLRYADNVGGPEPN